MEADEVGGGGQADGEAERFEALGDEGAGGALAVGAGDVHGGEALFRVAQLAEKGAGGVEPRLDAVGLPRVEPRDARGAFVRWLRVVHGGSPR